MLPRSSTLGAIALAVLLAACGSSDDGSSAGGESNEPPTTATAGVEQLTVEVVDTLPHDTGAYTQGLLVDDGVFVESTGQYGESDLREVEIDDGETLRQVALPGTYFGEGLTLVDDRLIQITWKEGVARVYDRDTFELVDEHTYEGEGWGLCLDDDRLVMSDGSSTLTFRDPDTFEVTGTVDVTADGEPVAELNELECVDGDVYANVYRTDEIVRIDPSDGAVTASIDASDLLDRDDDRAQRAQVLNGIAYDAEREAFYLTGKYWPYVYEVRFVPVSG